MAAALGSEGYKFYTENFTTPEPFAATNAVPAGVLYSKRWDSDGTQLWNDQKMFANRKMALGSKHTLFFVATPSNSSNYWTTLLSFRAYDAPGCFGFEAGTDGCLEDFACLYTNDYGPTGYTGPGIAPDVTQLFVFRTRMGFNVHARDGLGGPAPVVEMAAMTWSDWSPSSNLQWASSVHVSGHLKYETQGQTSEEFDIDLRSIDDDSHILAGGYMVLGHWMAGVGKDWQAGILPDSYFGFFGVIHHLELHNATLSNGDVDDVVNRLAVTYSSGAADPLLCRPCAPGSQDEDLNPRTECSPCGVGTFSDTAGATACTGTCHLGSTITATGSTSSADCNPSIVELNQVYSKNHPTVQLLLISVIRLIGRSIAFSHAQCTLIQTGYHHCSGLSKGTGTYKF